MNTETEEKSETISPAITLAFEKIVFKLCDEAEIEDADRLSKFREWVNNLEQKFRSLTADGWTPDEDAALLAVASLNPRNSAKRLRGGVKGFCKRLLFYKKYAPYRFLGVLLFAVYHSSVRSVHYLEHITLDIESINWHFYIDDWKQNIGVIVLILIFLWKGIYRVIGLPQLAAPDNHKDFQAISVTEEKKELRVNPFPTSSRNHGFFHAYRVVLRCCSRVDRDCTANAF